MDPYYRDVVSMLVRWLHVIAGIAWIGSSFYFIWLDRSLEPPAKGSDAERKGVGGELWAIHGGGFYNPQKYLVAPAALPEKLHWFKWEAYTTWLSGTALLVLVYWLRAGAMMVDQNVRALTPLQAVGLGAGSMIISWIGYDLLCKSALGKREGLLGLVVFGFITALSWGLARTLGGRAAFIHVGTAIGTIMAANVFFVIIPGQKRMVAAMRAGTAPDPRDGIRAKQRSVHNNYFTLPVVFTMISNHYAATYSHPHNWAVLMLIGAAGVLIRHFFNLKHTGVYLARQYPALGAPRVLLGLTAWWTMRRTRSRSRRCRASGPDFARVRSIIRAALRRSATPPPRPSSRHHCAAGRRPAAHAGQHPQERPAHLPAGDRHAHHAAGQCQITEEERAVIAAWVKAGAKRVSVKVARNPVLPARRSQPLPFAHELSPRPPPWCARRNVAFHRPDCAGRPAGRSDTAASGQSRTARSFRHRLWSHRLLQPNRMHPRPATLVENAVVKIFSHHARAPDPFKRVDKSRRRLGRAHRQRRGHRRQTHPDQCPCRPLRQPGPDSGQPGRRQDSPPRSNLSPPASTWRCSSSMTKPSCDTHPPLARATNCPPMKDTVMVYGFPTGGTNLSITKGIVSRIEFAGYNFPVSGLRIQIDAAINPGNSGGPALSGDEMIGLAFSRLGGADNIGYIIPVEEIEFFLKDIAGWPL